MVGISLLLSPLLLLCFKGKILYFETGCLLLEVAAQLELVRGIQVCIQYGLVTFCLAITRSQAAVKLRVEHLF